TNFYYDLSPPTRFDEEPSFLDSRVRLGVGPLIFTKMMSGLFQKRRIAGIDFLDSEMVQTINSY
ncbi:hypothetical protein, partial [Enterococcus diestrammenae]|uniref:hypothetical protein n=1 Tax=Enterococcus diestrammenae TaxID=1155073 RepID=UPI0022E6136F